ncbi:MAG: hypothetical protein ACRBI6_04000 [Acidimicrobiales bacterium]
MSDTHLFLSDPWIEAARALRSEYDDRLPEPPVGAKMNVVVTDIPHRDDLDGHIDTTAGELIIEQGHLDGAELLIKVDYDTALAAFVTQDQEAVMRAFFSGKIYVEGDASKLLAVQAPQVDPVAIEMYERLAAFTET